MTGGDRAGDDVAWRQLVGEAGAVNVEQQRAVAAQRFAEQEAVVDERCWMELHQLEVGQPRPRFVGEPQTVANRASWIRRPLPKRGIAAASE